MIDGENRRENVGVMAVLADIAGLDVRRVLAGRFHAVVAVDTVASDVDMVEVRGQPSRG